MSKFTQMRIALGLSEDQAVALVNAAAYERGVKDAADAFVKELSGMVHDRMRVPDLERMLLDSAPGEEGDVHA